MVCEVAADECGIQVPVQCNAGARAAERNHAVGGGLLEDSAERDAYIPVLVVAEVQLVVSPVVEVPLAEPGELCAVDGTVNIRGVHKWLNVAEIGQISIIYVRIL